MEVQEAEMDLPSPFLRMLGAAAVPVPRMAVQAAEVLIEEAEVLISFVSRSSDSVGDRNSD